MESAHSGHAILFLWHPGTADIFSGYGLVLAPAHLVGLLMVDRPEPVYPDWLATLERTFGSYQLTAMTQGGEQGLVCQMRIADDSMQYLRVLPHPHLGELRDALAPLLDDLPAVTLHLAWSAHQACWVSQIVHTALPLFALGRVVATPGALQALEDAGQEPEEFLNRHDRGDWGEVAEADKHENDFSLQHGFRILSAYTTKAGERIWIITEADRSVTTILLSDEY
jgi:hypothetical protein